MIVMGYCSGWGWAHPDGAFVVGVRILWMICQNIRVRLIWDVFSVNMYGVQRIVQGVYTPQGMVQ